MNGTTIGGDVIGAFGLMTLLILGGIAIDDSTVALVLVPIVFLLILYMMSKVPLRVSLMALMFCAFTLENPSENPAAGFFKTPLYIVGALLLTHMNNTSGIGWLSFSGMDVLLFSLFMIALQRRSNGSTIDKAGRVPTPEPLIRLAFLSLGGMAFVWMVGMLRGGLFSMSLWQMDRVMYLPIVFLLAQQALRGPKDFGSLARVVLTAAVFKGCLATYIANFVTKAPDQQGNTDLPYVTSHHDSILFAAAVVLLVAMVIQRVGPKALRLMLMLLPILMAGMIYNGRRMVWVQIGMVFLTLYLVTPPNQFKRRIRNAMIGLSPVILVYLVAGWNQKGGIFKPVQTIRSVVEPGTDASSITREIENYDIIYTIRNYPVFGTGYGNGYWEMIPLPPMGYPMERYCPHNSLLGLWAFCGYFGYAALTLLWVAGVYFGMRAYHASTTGRDKAAALMSFGVVLIYEIQCWGDMGLGSWTGVFLMGPALAVAGKLAVATGAWEVKEKTKKRARRRSVGVPAPAGVAPAGAAPAGFDGSRAGGT